MRLLQYRDKQADDAEVLRNADLIQRVFRDADATLILNDRVHLFSQTRFQGMHVGQDDMPLREVRSRIGPHAILGISTHNPDQLRDADVQDVSYVAIGPVYPTGTKANAEPVVGLDAVRAARRMTRKPLVAIGGITSARVPEALEAGADSVASIGALLEEGPRAFLDAIQGWRRQV